MRIGTMEKEHTDAALVTMSLESAQHFALLMGRYEQKLLRYIHRLTNIRQEEAEDILQDVFIKVYYNLRDYDPELKFSSWIYRIAHNVAISSFRKKDARPEGHTWELEDYQLEQISGELNVEQDVDHALQKETVQGVLAQMDVKYREVLVLKYLEDKSYEEISDILKKPSGTIATLLNRAKKKFKKLSEKDNTYG